MCFEVEDYGQVDVYGTQSNCREDIIRDDYIENVGGVEFVVGNVRASVCDVEFWTRGVSCNVFGVEVAGDDRFACS